MSRSAPVSDRLERRVATTARRLPSFALSDERLAGLVARDGEAPFAELYERYHQALYRYCRSIVRDEYDAQDALQSTMTGAFAALRKGQRDIAVRPWLFRIAHNESVSLLRRRRPQESPADEFVLVAPANAVEPAVVAEQRERLGTLLSDLRGLTIRQRSVLVMRELSGLPIAEIAAASSSTPGAVKQTLFEAREALRENEWGRSMECEQVRRLVSEEDRRALRGRRLRSHLQACAGCREFAETIASRRGDLRLLAPPLPAAAAAALLSHLLDTAAGASAGGVSAGASSGASGAPQAAAAGSSGTGAAASSGGVGTATTSSLAPSVATHAGGAIVAKALTAALVVTAGAAGVAGVTLSGSKQSGTARTGRNSSSSHGVSARHTASDKAASTSHVRHIGRSHPGDDRGAAGLTLAFPHSRSVATDHGRGNPPADGGTRAQDGRGSASVTMRANHGERSREAHEAAGGSARGHGTAKHQTSNGRQSRSKRAHREQPAKNRSAEHSSSGSSRPTKHVPRKASVPRAQRRPKEPSNGRPTSNSHGKPRAGTNATPAESEAVSVESTTSEHGKATH
jgi:RNA polymerase sigma factor (sigma-70 family)